MIRSLRIAQAAPPTERVPPEGYGGTERIVHELAVELHRRGHIVTVFGSGSGSPACTTRSAVKLHFSAGESVVHPAVPAADAGPAS